MTPVRWPDASTVDAAAGVAAEGPTGAARDIVARAEAGVDAKPAAGRDAVDEAADGGAMALAASPVPVADAEAGVAPLTAERIPVVEAEAGVDPLAAGRIPVAEADAGVEDFDAGADAVAVAAAAGDAPAPMGDIRVVPHCTQNLAPG